MKPFKPLTSIVFALSIVLSGCTGVEYSANHQGGNFGSTDGEYKRVLVTNYGYYLFNIIPLGSGGSTDNSFSLFSDNVSLNAAMDTFNAECKKNNVTEIGDLQVERTETSFFSWAPLGTTLGLYWYREIQISATVSASDSENASTAAMEQKQ